MQAKNVLLESQLAKLTGELSQHKRSRFGKRSEKSPDKPTRDKAKTKEESEDDCINNGNNSCRSQQGGGRDYEGITEALLR